MHYEYSSYTGFRCFACNIGFNNFDDQKKHYFAYHANPINQNQNVSRPQISPYKPKSLIGKPLIVSLRCDVCEVSCTSKIVYDLHMKGKKHIKALNKLNTIIQANPKSNGQMNENIQYEVDELMIKKETIEESEIKSDVFCRECSVHCSTVEQLHKHLTGAKHIKVLKMKKYAEMKEIKDPSVYCDICDLYLLDDLMKTHRDGGKHKRKCTEKSPNEPVGKKTRLIEVVTTVEYCGYCLLDLKNGNEAVEHYQSRQHLTTVSKNKNHSELWCDICRTPFNNQNFLDLHLKGYKHYVKLNRGNPNPEGEFAPKLLKMRGKLRELNVKQSGQRFAYRNRFKMVSGETSNDGDSALPMGEAKLEGTVGTFPTVVVALDSMGGELPLIDASLDVMDAALPTTNVALENMDAALPTINTVLENMDAALPTTNTGLDIMDAAQPSIDVALETMVTALPTIDAAMATIENDAPLPNEPSAVDVNEAL